MKTVTTTNQTTKHIKKQQQQTRGRPRKNVQQKLPQISRRLFSQHQAVFYTTCLLYVQQILEQLPCNQQKHNHNHHNHLSSCGFAIYDDNNNNKLLPQKVKVNEQYSFENILKHCQQWNLTNILSNKQIIQFIKISNGCAPKLVFYEILLLIQNLLGLLQLLLEQQQQQQKQLQQQQQQQQLSQVLLEKILLSLLSSQHNVTTQQKYKYITFTYEALKQIGLQKYYQSHRIKQRVYLLWGKFVKIIVYTVYCVVNHINQSRYYPFFFQSNSFNSNTISRGKQQLKLKEIADWFDHNDNKEQNQQQDNSEKSYNSNRLLQLEISKMLEQNKQQKQLIHSHHLQQQPILTIKSRFHPILLSKQIQQQHQYHHHLPMKKIKLQ